MFQFMRFMRPSKSVLSVSRLPIKVELQAARGEVYKVQNVRFQKQRFRPRALAITVMTGYISYWAYTMVVLGPIENALAEADPDPDPEHEEEAPIFIPFPGTTKTLERRPYTPSDPDYQEFVKFFASESEQQYAKEELASYVQKILSKHPVYSAKYGVSKNVSRVWLTLSMTKAPPVVMRSGIEITDDYIAWVSEPVDPEKADKIRRVLVPESMAKAVWGFAKTVLVDDTKRLARFLGFQIDDYPPSYDELIARLPHKAKALPPAAKQPQLLGDTQTQKSDVLSTQNQDVAKKPAAQEGANIGLAKSTVVAMYKHFIRGLVEFKTKLRQSARAPPTYIGGPSIVVDGLVELETEKALLAFKVRGVWDLKTSSYDPKNTVIQFANVDMPKPAS